MPYLRVTLSIELSDIQQEKLYHALGEALSTLPGKDAHWLIASFDCKKPFFFDGHKQEEYAFLEARYVGKYETSLKKVFTQKAFKAMNEITGIPMDKMCLTIDEYSAWGALGDYHDTLEESSK